MGQALSLPAWVILAALHDLKRAPLVAMPRRSIRRLSIDCGRLPSVSLTLKPSVAPTGAGALFDPFFAGEKAALVVYSLAAEAADAGTSNRASASVAKRSFLVMGLLSEEETAGVLPHVHPPRRERCIAKQPFMSPLDAPGVVLG